MWLHQLGLGPETSVQPYAVDICGVFNIPGSNVGVPFAFLEGARSIGDKLAQIVEYGSNLYRCLSEQPGLESWRLPMLAIHARHLNESGQVPSFVVYGLCPMAGKLAVSQLVDTLAETGL